MSEKCTSSNVTTLLSDIASTRQALYKSLMHFYANSRDEMIRRPCRRKDWDYKKRSYEIARRGYLETMKRVSSIFSEFHIVDGKTIYYGCKKKGNFRICVYGKTDAFRNSICIHVERLEELIRDEKRFDKDILVTFESYQQKLNQFYYLASHKSLWNFWAFLLFCRDAFIIAFYTSFMVQFLYSFEYYEREKTFMNNNVSCLEALLFASGKPVDSKILAEVMGISLNELKEVANELENQLSVENSGIQLIEINDGYQLSTNEAFYDKIIKLLDTKQKPSLSQAAMEVLAIISYNQKITRAEIEKIRGVSSDSAINRLLEYNLIEEAGRLDAPGRPMTFKTTDEFLRLFGYKSLADMPELPRIVEEDAQIQMEDIVDSSSNQQVEPENLENTEQN